MHNFNSINKVNLAGVIYNEPINSETNQGVPVSSIYLLTATKHPKKDQLFKQITPISFYNRISEAVERNLEQGDYIYVEGKLYVKKNTLPNGTLEQRAHVVAEHYLKLKENAGIDSIFSNE